VPPEIIEKSPPDLGGGHIGHAKIYFRTFEKSARIWLGYDT